VTLKVIVDVGGVVQQDNDAVIVLVLLDVFAYAIGPDTGRRRMKVTPVEGVVQ
jgi:hypothetical protein